MSRDRYQSTIELMAYDDGYKQAETDYFQKTEQDRQRSYDCGYQQGRANALNEVREVLGCFEHDCENCFYREGTTCKLDL